MCSPEALEALNYVLDKMFFAHGKGNHEKVRRDALLAWLEQWSEQQLKSWVNRTIFSHFREKAREEEPFYNYLSQKVYRELVKMAKQNVIRSRLEGKSRLFEAIAAGPTTRTKREETEIQNVVAVELRRMIANSRQQTANPLEIDVQPLLAYIINQREHREICWSGNDLTRILAREMKIPRQFSKSFSELITPTENDSEREEAIPEALSAYQDTSQDVETKVLQHSEPAMRTTFAAEIEHPDILDWASCVGGELLGIGESQTPKQATIARETALVAILVTVRNFPTTENVIGLPSTWTKAMANGEDSYATLAKVMNEILNATQSGALKSYVKTSARNRFLKFRSFFVEQYNEWKSCFDDSDEFPMETALFSLLKFLFQQLPDDWRVALS